MLKKLKPHIVKKLSFEKKKTFFENIKLVILSQSVV